MKTMIFQERNLTVRGYSFGPTLGRPMMSPGSSQQEFIKHQVHSPHYATNTPRRQKHVPAFQTISQRRRHMRTHSTRITEHTLLHAANEGEEDSQQVSVLHQGLTKKLTRNCMPSKRPWISLKILTNPCWNARRESSWNHGSLKETGGIQIDQENLPDNIN